MDIPSPKFEQGFAIFQANRAVFLLSVIEELGGGLHLSRCVSGFEEGTYGAVVSIGFSHHFCNIVCPSRVSQKFCGVATVERGASMANRSSPPS